MLDASEPNYVFFEEVMNFLPELLGGMPNLHYDALYLWSVILMFSGLHILVALYMLLQAFALSIPARNDGRRENMLR